MGSINQAWDELNEELTLRDFENIDEIATEMETDSRFSKVVKVIKSCATLPQLVSSTRMINNYISLAHRSKGMRSVYEKYILLGHVMDKAIELKITEDRV